MQELGINRYRKTYLLPEQPTTAKRQLSGFFPPGKLHPIHRRTPALAGSLIVTYLSNITNEFFVCEILGHLVGIHIRPGVKDDNVCAENADEAEKNVKHV